MKNFFTYGYDDKYPFEGGWSQIDAPLYGIAISFHKGYHPYLDGRALNCASYYNEETFKATSMYESNNNLGNACQEHFKIVELATSVGNMGYWVEPKSLKVYPVIVSAQDEENRELVTLDVLIGDKNIKQVQNINISDIFIYESDASDFAAQLSRYK